MRKMYLYCIENHDDAMLRIDEREYPSYEPDCVYADFDAARARMRKDYLDYRSAHPDIGADRFKWNPGVLESCGRKCWTCYDIHNPHGWCIVELDIAEANPVELETL